MCVELACDCRSRDHGIGHRGPSCSHPHPDEGLRAERLEVDLLDHEPETVSLVADGHHHALTQVTDRLVVAVSEAIRVADHLFDDLGRRPLVLDTGNAAQPAVELPEERLEQHVLARSSNTKSHAEHFLTDCRNDQNRTNVRIVDIR